MIKTISLINMLSIRTVVFCAVLQCSWGIDANFPRNFIFGASTAAYQIEGGWNADGKGENIWDRYVHEYPGDIKGNATGDVAADSYHLWREDVKAATMMGLNFYRFSIDWARILPTGFTNEFNKVGAKYYSDLIDALLANGIEPVVTLYHWELPVKIQELGGWTNPLIVKWFGDYVRVVYSLYADRVKTWLTINEPNGVCDIQYNTVKAPPRFKEPVLAPFLCNKYMLLAHAKAYRIFENEFRSIGHIGRISIVINLLGIEPANPNDTALAELGREHQAGRYSYAIFSKEGGWPPKIERLMLEVSLKEGFKESRLPPFSKQEIEYIKGTADFYAMNYYTTYLIRPARPGDPPGVWFLTGSPELNAILEMPPYAETDATSVLPVVPEGIRKELNWVKQRYGDVEILITENGYSTNGHQLKDPGRIDFIKRHLEQVLLALKVDKVKVIGYSVWAMIDTFEWLDGYTTKFGLFEIEYENNHKRTPRDSAYYYACIIKKHSLDIGDCYRCNETASSYKELNKFNGRRFSAPHWLL